MKNKTVSVIILVITLILAGIAIFTAVRLYQLRQTAVAPNVPESEPAAAVPDSCTGLAFTLDGITDTPLKICDQSCAASSECETGKVCSSGKCRNASCLAEADCECPTAVKICNDTCTANSECESDKVCSSGKCRNASCLAEADCECPTGTATPTGTSTGTATATSTRTSTVSPTGTLPDAGVPAPTIFGIGFGAILLIIAIALAL